MWGAEQDISRGWLFIILTILGALPAATLRVVDLFGLAELHLSAGLAVLVYGGGIIMAAFLVSWAAEVAQKDISQALALAFLAFIAVLPEYSVDLYFAWKAGTDPAGPYVSYATANMTGANRLLVGFGWPLIILLFWLRKRAPLELERGLSLELLFLGIATLYAFTIPFTGGIALWDGVVMVALFGLYLWFSGRAKRVEPELMGPAATIGALAPPRRRVIVVSLFIFSAATILASAEPFAESLLKAGRTLGIDEFVMVQWVAPLASESPEILIAVIFTIKGQVRMAMTALISAEVNQWTLLVGTLPFVYTASLGQFTLLGLPLDARQAEEIWLTAAQSLFAVVLLARLRLNGWAGLALLLLWAGQLGFTTTEARFVFVGLYLAATVGLLALDRGRLGALRRLLPESLKVARGS